MTSALDDLVIVTLLGADISQPGTSPININDDTGKF